MKMGHGDSVFSAGTALGTVYGISVATGAVRRRFSVSTTIADVDISADGKALFVADGTSQVSMKPLATGRLSGSIDICLAVTGVAESPDANQLWVSQGNAVYAAPADGNSFNPSLVAGRAPVARH